MERTMTTNTGKLDDFEKLFNMALDMLCIAGTDGYFKVINPSFSRILGYNNGVLLENPFLEFIHPDDIEETIHEIEKLKDGINTVKFHNRYRRIDGTYRFISWSASVDPENGLLYCVARDVTEEKENASHLIQIQNVLNNETIVAMTDIRGTIIEVNDKFCDISGYRRDELIGQNHRILNSGNHPKEFFVDMWKTISSGKPWTGMIENRKKNGEHYFVQSIITPILDIQGKISNYLAIRFDTTKHIHIKQELKKTLSILNETGQIAKVGGWELDVKSDDLTWTDETFNILEVEKQANRKPILPEGLNLFTPTSKSIIENAVQRAIEFGEPYSLELEALTAKGNIIWIYTNGKANYENGEIVTISGTIQDINSRKIAEKQFEQERQKSIRNAKLASLGELAAGIAHEINNPLTIINGYAQLMTKQLNEPEKLNENIDEILKSCDRISRIVKSLKKFSRTSDQTNLSPHQLGGIVREAITLTDAKANRNLISITFSCNANGLIICDEIEIEQVIVNLINNAIDANKNNVEKWIKISTYETETDIFLIVTDSGSGISSDTIDRIFDPFFTTKKTGEGTGLGLSITKGILDDHNAIITVDEDSPNTCFKIQFTKYAENIYAY